MLHADVTQPKQVVRKKLLMPRVTVELNVPADAVNLPIIWRLAALFKVVTNVRRARISSERGAVSLEIDGSSSEVEQAQDYLASLHVMEGSSTSTPPPPPEDSIPQPNTIIVRLTTVNKAQAAAPLLARVARDYRVVINICFAALDEDGGTVEVAISGALLEVQRAISFLHTTGVSVSPYERSVSDSGNL
jgi:ABC-type methionine transport system ATPase subunit